MRNIMTLTLSVLVLTVGAATAQAQMGYLSAVHGIPGLAEPVDVFVNGGYLDSFDFGETLGPLPVAAGSYDLEIFYQNALVLSGTAVVEDGGNYTAVAHLDESGAIAPLSLFANSTGALSGPTISRGGFQSRLQVFHLAAAPTVDVSLRPGRSVSPRVELIDLSNGEQATAIDIRSGVYNVGFLANQTEVFNTGLIKVPAGANLGVYAVGEFPTTFQLVFLPLD